MNIKKFLFIILCSISLTSHSIETITLPNQKKMSTMLKKNGFADFDRKTSFSENNANKQLSPLGLVMEIDNNVFLYTQSNQLQSNINLMQLYQILFINNPNELEELTTLGFV